MKSIIFKTFENWRNSGRKWWSSRGLVPTWSRWGWNPFLSKNRTFPKQKQNTNTPSNHHGNTRWPATRSSVVLIFSSACAAPRAPRRSCMVSSTITTDTIIIIAFSIIIIINVKVLLAVWSRATYPSILLRWTLVAPPADEAAIQQTQNWKYFHNFFHFALVIWVIVVFRGSGQ